MGSGCGGSPTSPSKPVSPRNDGPPPPPPLTGQTVVVAAVGDIGLCGSPAVEQTAQLVEAIDGQVLLAGDLAYPQGSMTDFLRCFDPSWGAFRRRWRPSPGNHEYETAGASSYFQYFGMAAGTGGRSFYSFRAGDWLVLMLDSNIPTGVGSSQYEFVRSELTSSPAPCALAVWHHPLLHVRTERPEHLSARSLDAALRPRRGRHRQRPRSSVRAIRQAGCGRTLRWPRHSSVHRRHRRRAAVRLHAHHAEFASPHQVARRAAAHSQPLRL